MQEVEESGTAMTSGAERAVQLSELLIYVFVVAIVLVGGANWLRNQARKHVP